MAEDEVIEGAATELGAVPAGASEDEIRAAMPDLTRAVARADVEGDEFRAMELLDEAQILDELLGHESGVLVYSFQSKSGLSWKGVAEAVRELNTRGQHRIRVSPHVQPVFEEFDQVDEETGEIATFIGALVYAEDEYNGGGQWGAAAQRKMMVYKEQDDGTRRKPTVDGFARTKALSKAQRNAELPLVPLVFREAIIAQAINQPEKVKKIRKAAGHQQAIGPAPLDDDRAKKLVAEIKAIYDQMREVDPGDKQGRPKLLPGAFNANLQRVLHSHEGLELYRDALVEQLEKWTAEADDEGAET